MFFKKDWEKKDKELQRLRKAELKASKNVEKASKRLNDIIAENGFHLKLYKAVSGKEKQTHAS